MLVYLSNLIFILMTLLVTRTKQYLRKNNKFIYLTMILYTFISMVLIAGLRYDVGTDYMEYKNIFYNFKNGSLFSDNIELIFSLICKIVLLITDDSVWMFIIVAIFIYYFVYKIAFENTVYYELSVFLFIAFGFYTSTFNIMRQWMACIVGLYSLISINKYKNNTIYFLIFLSILCHNTAIVLIPSYFFIKANIKNTSRIIIIIVSTILSLKIDLIMNLVKFIVSNINILSRYDKYLGNYEIISGSAFLFPMFCLIVYILYLIYKERLINVDKNTEKNINILTLAYCFSILGQKLMIFNRIQFFFVPILIVIIPQILYSMKLRDQKLFYPVCILMGVAFFIYGLIQNGGQPLPYQTIFYK